MSLGPLDPTISVDGRDGHPVRQSVSPLHDKRAAYEAVEMAVELFCWPPERCSYTRPFCLTERTTTTSIVTTVRGITNQSMTAL